MPAPILREIPVQGVIVLFREPIVDPKRKLSSNIPGSVQIHLPIFGLRFPSAKQTGASRKDIMHPVIPARPRSAGELICLLHPLRIRDATICSERRKQQDSSALFVAATDDLCIEPTMRKCDRGDAN
jgi:hypothetical protein